MADVSVRFSDTQEKPETSDVQIITHNNKKKKRKYYYVSSTRDSWSNDSDCQQFDKRQKTKKKNRGSNEQKQGNPFLNGVMTKSFDLLISTRRDLAYGTFSVPNITTGKRQQ